MKKAIISLFLIISVIISAYSLGVDINELTTGKNIVFINYTGVQSVSTVDVIKGIGVQLSHSLKTGKTTATYANKYNVIHAFDPSVKEKLDADIMILTPSAGVNHINSLRLIIAGYLEQQYGYTVTQARTLSIFITVYNAVYRGNIGYYNEKYKEIVTKNLQASTVGLSTHYKDWPGSTQLVIPITEAARTSDINALDTSTLTEKTVIDALKTQDDKGIEERKEMIVIKEQQLEEDKQEVETTKQELETEKQKLETEKQELEDKKTNLENTEKVLETTTDDKTKEEIKVVTEIIKEDVKKTEENVTQKEQEIATREEEVTKTEEKITEKEKEIEEEKKDVARDERIVEITKDPVKAAEEILEKEEELKIREEELKNAQTDKKILAGKFYYLQIEEYLAGGHYNNSLYILNATTGEALVKSPVANISGRKYDLAPGQGVLVITHKGQGSENTYLSLLDIESLETKYVGDDAIFHRSFVEVKGNYAYAVVNLNNTYYLGKYDMQCKRVAVSKETVYEDSYITFYNDRIYINSRDNKILALKLEDLSLIEKITPGL